MVTHLLGLASEPARDAADAIAVGLTHLHSNRSRLAVDGRR
jgi:Holliday junction resolvasome RuvABC endonuclease subunit